MDIVIIGGGPAGIHAALQSRQSWPRKSVILVEGESHIGYCRPLLPQFMAGQAGEEKLFLFKPGREFNPWTGRKAIFSLKTGKKSGTRD